MKSGVLQLSLFDLVCENITRGFEDSMNSQVQKYKENEKKRKQAEKGKKPELRSQRIRELIQGINVKRG